MIKTSKRLNSLLNDIISYLEIKDCQKLRDLADVCIIRKILLDDEENSFEKDILSIENGIELSKKSVNKKLPIYKVEGQSLLYRVCLYNVALYKTNEEILESFLEKIREDN